MAVCVSYSVLKGGKRWVREATQQLFVCAILRLLLFFHVFPSPPVSTDAFDRQARESIYTRDTRTVDFLKKRKKLDKKKKEDRLLDGSQFVIEALYLLIFHRNFVGNFEGVVK